jgi:hypothetical protein
VCSSKAFRRARSLRLARRIAEAMNGAKRREKPVGLPRFRSVMRVLPCSVDSQIYVVSMGKGPATVRMTRRSCGLNSVTSYV